MKVKGRIEKWIPGRPLQPPEEGAVGGEGVYRSTIDRQVSFEDNSLASDQASGVDLGAGLPCLPLGTESDNEDKHTGREGYSSQRSRNRCGSDSPGRSSITTQSYSIPSTSHCSSGSTCSFYTPGATSPRESISNNSCVSQRSSIGTNSSSLPGISSFSTSSSTIYHIVPDSSKTCSSSVPEINQNASKRHDFMSKVNPAIDYRSSSPLLVAMEKYQGSFPSNYSERDTSEKDAFLPEPPDLESSNGSNDSPPPIDLAFEGQCKMNIPTEFTTTEETHLHKLPEQGLKGGKKNPKCLSNKLQLDLQHINQPATDTCPGSPQDDDGQTVSSQVKCNGRLPKVKIDDMSISPDEGGVPLLSTTSPSIVPSPNRKVTFHESVLQAAETRKLIIGDTVRIVRVRDAAVNTPEPKPDYQNNAVKNNTSLTVDAAQSRRPSGISPRLARHSVISLRMQPPDDGSDASSGTGDDDDDDVSKGTMVRETWSGKLDFLVSALGYAIGLGNVWRFPYLCYRNGGGAFLLPYFFFVIVVGIPLVFLEVSFGQFAGLGPISIWNVSPIFKGVGMTMIALSFVVSVYYNVILSWALFYLFASMQYPLPWTACNNSWNTQDCCTTRFVSVGSCSGQNGTFMNETTCYYICGDKLSKNTSDIDTLSVNDTSTISPFSTTYPNTSVLYSWVNDSDSHRRRGRLRSPAEEYFSLYLLGGRDYERLLGRVQWKLALCLLLTTIIIFLCLFKGARTSGKVTYLTVLAPYFILLVLLIKTSTLDGAKQGIVFYMSPQWHRLADPQVWHDAINQVFFSLAPCYGGLITLASFNKFHHNCYRDALLIPIGNCLTSIFSGFPIFCTLGYMATHLGTDIKNVVSTGAGLAFVVYPEAVAQMPGSTVWAILFFLMLLALGLDTLLVYVVTIVTAIMDEYPKLLYRWRVLVLFAVCIVLYFSGLPLITQGGVFVIEVLDKYVTSYPPVIVGILECFILMWIYGYSRFAQDVWYMFGKQPGRWWRLLWQFVTPSLLLFLLIFNGISQNVLPYVEGNSPEESFVLGWAFAGVCILPIPVYAIYASATISGSFIKRIRHLFRPAEGWGLYTEQIDGHTIVPDYIKSEEEEEEQQQIVPSVGDIPELPPHQETPDHYDGNEDPMEKGFNGMDGDDIDTGSLVWNEDENKERGNWHGRYDFLMAGLGYTIGLGNVWRFPYLVYKNGGGAFFLPYLLMLVTCGLPLMFMELALGQFASVGAITIWKVSPLFKGIGYVNMIVQFLVVIYYNVLSGWSFYYLWASISIPWKGCNSTWNTEGLGYATTLIAIGAILYYNAMSAWALYYLSASFTSSLPWAKCGNPWNTPACRELKSLNGHKQNVTGPVTCSLLGDRSLCGNWTNVTTFHTPSEEYFFNHVLNVSSGIGDVGQIQLPLALCMLASSVFTFLALIKGVKSIGKIVYVTVSFPYLILLVLLARYVTLGDGHLNGMKFYVTPQWHRLHDATVWGDAASQLFFSLGLSMGGLISLSSYNRFHYDCYRDAYLICLIDTLTSVFAGFVIFAILGVMADEAGIEIQEVVTNKFSLAFVVYPEAVTKLPLAPFWSLLFFLMLFCLAIDSQFLMTASIVISLLDEFSTRPGKYRVWVSLVICIFLYFLGLPMASQGGLYFLMLLDYYVAAWCPIVVAVLTCVAICWVYGLKSFLKNMRVMLGKSPSFWWQGMWKFITPTVLLVLLFFIWSQYQPPNLDDYVYPAWANTFGLFLGIGPLLAIPLTFAIQLCRTPGSGLVIIRRAMAPNEGWGPALKHHRTNVYLPQLPALEPTWSNNWLVMAKEMSIYATETSAVVAMAAGAYDAKLNPPPKNPSKKFKEKTLTITTSGSSSDKIIQTDGHHHIDEEHTIVSPRKAKSLVKSVDASTQTDDTPRRKTRKRGNSSGPKLKLEIPEICIASDSEDKDKSEVLSPDEGYGESLHNLQTQRSQDKVSHCENEPGSVPETPTVSKISVLVSSEKYISDEHPAITCSSKSQPSASDSVSDAGSRNTTEDNLDLVLEGDGTTGAHAPEALKKKLDILTENEIPFIDEDGSVNSYTEVMDTYL